MRYFAGRRLRWVLSSLAVAVLVLAFSVAWWTSFLPVDLATGWLLLGGMVFLACLGARKRLSVLPLGPASTWVQAHVYLGLLLVLVFVIHIGLRLPDGPLEVALAVVFLTISVSGMLGILLSRVLPPRLAARGEEVILERAPILRRRLREQAETLVLESVKQTDRTTLSDFYLASLSQYFDRPAHFWAHLLHLSRPWQALVERLDAQYRYLDDGERSIAVRLRQLIVRKADLDYQVALQTTLKAWLFVHVPLTGAALILALVHASVVYWVREGSV